MNSLLDQRGLRCRFTAAEPTRTGTGAIGAAGAAAACTATFSTTGALGWEETGGGGDGEATAWLQIANTAKETGFLKMGL